TDDVYNAAEADTATLTGQVEDGATIDTLNVASDAGGEPVVIQGDDITLESDGSFTTTADLSGLDDGELTATLSITDAAGNTGTVTDSATLDQTPPVITLNPVDDPINNDSPALSGTVDDPDATVTVTVDGMDYAATVDGETWSLEAGTVDLAEGDNAITVNATDPAGNPATLVTETVSVDVTAPNDGNNDITIVSDDDALLSADEADTATLTGQVEDGAAIDTLAVTSDAGGDPVTIQGGDIDLADDGSFTTTADLSGLDDGELTATLSITDAAGNTGTVTDSATLDQTPPVITLNPVDDPINNDSPALSGSVDDPDATVTVTVDGTDYAATIDGNSWTLPDGTVDLAEGDNAITVNATDLAGNPATPVTETVSVDVTAPDAPVIANATDDVEPLTDDLGSGDSTNDLTPTLTGTAEASSTIEIFQDGTSVGTTEADDQGRWSFTPETKLAEGDVSFTAEATDAAGNTSPDSNIFTLTIDETAPDAPTIDPTDGTELTGTAEAGSTVTIDTNGDGEADETATVGENGSWSVTPQTPVEDGTEISATATDAAGNKSEPTTQTVDATAPDAPVITNATDDVEPLTEDLADGDSTNDLTPTLTGSAEAGSTVEIFQNDTSVGTTEADDQGSWSFTPETELAEGDVSFTAEATDAAGNTSDASETFTLTIDETAPDAPTIDPTDGTELTGTAEAGSTVTIDTNGDGEVDETASADGDGTWSVTPEPVLADDTQVSATATDAAG
ncbi:Ig-like domain-containing protein, partial [Chromohalobacter sp. 48-RD10]|uniref:Ig-like domain-containing protein n=1 Tax=Chromohalobacter sp. 48-RD10 TaxID=2994063 RepID=UPI002468E44A